MIEIVWQRTGTEGYRTTDRREDEPSCQATHDDWICTLTLGHLGTHIAGLGGGTYGLEWIDTDYACLRVPEGL